MRIAPVALAFIVLVGASPVSGQEDSEPEPATILMVSQWQCPQSEIGNIAEYYEEHTKPIEEEIVAEGLGLASAGLFFHIWADEWNVNYYRTGYDIGELMDAIAMVGERFAERNPTMAQDPGPFAACTAHKDNIYGFGPRTGVPSPGGN